MTARGKSPLRCCQQCYDEVNSLAFDFVDENTRNLSTTISDTDSDTSNDDLSIRSGSGVDDAGVLEPPPNYGSVNRGLASGPHTYHVPPTITITATTTR